VREEFKRVWGVHWGLEIGTMTKTKMAPLENSKLPAPLLENIPGGCPSKPTKKDSSSYSDKSQIAGEDSASSSESARTLEERRERWGGILNLHLKSVDQHEFSTNHP
jgi:hypothetical protein